MPPAPGESERDWLARQTYWVNRECSETHDPSCSECRERVEYVRSDKPSREPGTAQAFLDGLAEELREKSAHGERRVDAFPRGTRSKASVYILLGEKSEVLYVGKAKSVRARIWNRPGGHAASKPWFKDVREVLVYDYQTEGEAFDAEARAIFDLSPLHNRAIPTVPTHTPVPVDQWLFASPEAVLS